MIQPLAIGILGCFVGIIDKATVSIVSAKSQNAYCFQDKHWTPQAFVGPSHFWSHTSLVTSVVYSSASARRTAPWFGELAVPVGRTCKHLTKYTWEKQTKQIYYLNINAPWMNFTNIFCIYSTLQIHQLRKQFKTFISIGFQIWYSLANNAILKSVYLQTNRKILLIFYLIALHTNLLLTWNSWSEVVAMFK